jgi:hypothetical protein
LIFGKLYFHDAVLVYWEVDRKADLKTRKTIDNSHRVSSLERW